MLAKAEESKVGVRENLMTFVHAIFVLETNVTTQSVTDLIKINFQKHQHSKTVIKTEHQKYADLQ